MQVIKKSIIGLTVMVLFRGCIDPYTPEIDEIPEMIVISGRITDQEGYHSVEVSKSTSYNEPYYNPVSYCTVVITDDKNQRFDLTEYAPGKYRCWVGKEFLNAGTGYRVEVTTPDGKQYQSDYEMILPCPPIATIFYESKKQETDNPDYPLYGLQFYVSTDASGFTCRNFLYDLTETWEYHSTYMVSDYYDGEIHFSDVVYDTLFYCWQTSKLYDIYTFTTKNLTTDKITRCPLNFVSNQSLRLSVKYSLLVRQYSMGDEAYEYWNTIQQQTQHTGGLYETQPVSITGNVHCITHPDETVLGYFMASAVTEKRIFVPRHFDFSVYTPPCQAYGYDSEALSVLLQSYKPRDYPVFLLNLTGLKEGPWDFADQECFDCTKRGGTTVKPAFWE
ncbi:MAG: DUF4249 domain-containing protein [Bacteroidales bacterium]|nr:DUF4249 domain-containing protein [Bacteroidales bacterium]